MSAPARGQLAGETIPPTYQFWTYTPNPFGSSAVKVRFPKLINPYSDDLEDWEREEARLQEQYELYQNDFLNSTTVGRREYMNTMAQRISEALDNIDVEKRLIIINSNTKENTRTNSGRGVAMTHGEQLERRMKRQAELYPDAPRIGGMILQQSKKHFNRFKVSDQGYGVEVDNLITLVSKKTLIELMKGMYTPIGFSVSRLRKMSKGEVANYFMENFAEGPIDRRKTKERNRPETKLQLGTPMDNAAKYGASRQNSLEVKKKRPPPVRTGISL